MHYRNGRWVGIVGLVACAELPSKHVGSVSLPHDPRPNILFLFADDQRPDSVAAFGNSSIQTPHLDQLVAAGTSFRRNYCMGSMSGAVCLPSRAMVHSGRSLHRVKSNLAGVKTLGEVLGAAGYRTFGTGKWHNGSESFQRSFQEGEAVMLGGMSDHRAVPLYDLMTDGSGMGNKRIGVGHSTDLFADAALGFLDRFGSSGREKPFFAFVAFSAPHDPRDPVDSWREHYTAHPPELPPNFLGQHPWNFDPPTLTIRDEVLTGWPRERDVVTDQLGEYYGLISHVDERMGDILGKLEELGVLENTLVLYSADHGLALGSHGLLGKQNLYEHSMGCPLVLKGPGIPVGRESQALTYLFDIFPTLCAAAGAPVPEGVEGRDLLPTAWREVDGVRESLLTVYKENQMAVTDGRWKLIRFPKIDVTLLFDLDGDPGETTNLADDPSHAETKGRMESLLREQLERYAHSAPWTTKNQLPKQVDLTGRTRKPDRHQPDWIVKKYF